MAETTDTNSENSTKTEVDIKTVQAFLESNEEGKKFLQSYTDAKITKALKTYESETVPKLVDSEISKRYPAETPEQKKLKEMESKLASLETEAKREKLVNLALTEAQKRNLPTKLVKYLVADNDEVTLKNIEEFETEYFSAVSNNVDDKLKVGGRRVPQQTQNSGAVKFVEDYSQEELRAMTSEEFRKLKSKNK
jgi:hypothetical protein